MHSKKATKLEEIYREIFFCRKCPKIIPSEASRRIVESTINSNIFMMAQAPSEHGIRESGLHWVDKDGNLLKSGRYLDKYLVEIGYSIDPNLQRPYTSNVLHCWTGKRGKWDRPPERYELLNCMPWWNNEIDIINPKIIILLGEKAVKSLKIINIEKYDFAYLLNRQGEEIKIGNKYLIRFVLPHPSAPYKEKELPNRTKSEIYKQVFSQIKDILKR